MPLHGAFLVITLVVLVVKVVALIDAVTRKEQGFVYHDKQTKQFWLVVLVLAVVTTFVSLLNVIGLVAALVYLLDVRPALASR